MCNLRHMLIHHTLIWSVTKHMLVDFYKWHILFFFLFFPSYKPNFWCLYKKNKWLPLVFHEVNIVCQCHALFIEVIFCLFFFCFESVTFFFTSLDVMKHDRIFRNLLYLWCKNWLDYLSITSCSSSVNVPPLKVSYLCTPCFWMIDCWTSSYLGWVGHSLHLFSIVLQWTKYQCLYSTVSFSFMNSINR